MTNFNINTRQLTYEDIGLKRNTFTDELIYMFRKANRSESSLCWWLISSNSWLNSKTPIYLMDDEITIRVLFMQPMRSFLGLDTDNH